MFTDESGRLVNIPSVETLKQAIRECDCRGVDAFDKVQPSTKSLIEQIIETVGGSLAEAKLSPSEDDARKYILKEFAKSGKPPSEEAIAEAMNLLSVEAAHRLMERLHKADILTKDDDEIISAYPFSARETRHKAIFKDGHEVFALCATDALGIHFLLREDITVRSHCPECESEIKIEVSDGKVSSCVPDGVVEFVSSREQCGCTAKTFCPYMNLFCSEGHLEKWREKNPAYGKGEKYRLEQVLEHGKKIFEDFLK